MGFEYMEPPDDSQAQKQERESERQATGGPGNTAGSSAYRNTSHSDDEITAKRTPIPAPELAYYQEPSFREHVSGNLAWHPSEAPRFRQAYPAYPAQYQDQPAQPAAPVYVNQGGYQGYPGYNNQPIENRPAYQPYPYPYAGYPGYYGYPGYTYPWQPAKPPRDGYLLGMSITSFIASILVLLGGLGCALILTLLLIAPNTTAVPAKSLFSGVVMFTALTTACLLGGGFSFYHSIRSLFLKRPSAALKLPWFWIFLGLYIMVVIVGGILSVDKASIANIPFTIFLIVLAGVLPALTILALGLRRVSRPKQQRWPTTWRRFTLAIVSGATSAILFASIFELILSLVVGHSLGITGFSIDNPDQSMLQNPRVIAFLFLLLSVIAPLVEEAVKPLAAIMLIGRINSAAEAFVLGLSCGIGFDLIETSGYISQGYQDWLKVALERSTAGLLHGFGAAMVTLGWYYLTHRQASQHRFLLGFGCILYAVLQHAVWNGTFLLQLLPAPVGPFFADGKIALGSVVLTADLLPYIALSIVMVAFFLYVSGKVRLSRPAEDARAPQPQVSYQGKALPVRV